MRHCEQYWDLISDHLDGALSAGEQVRLEEHLAICPECRELLAQLRAIQRDMPGVEPAPKGFADGVMAAVSQVEQDIPFTALPQQRDIHREDRAWLKAWWKPIKHWCAIAACCLIILGLGTILTRSGLFSADSAASGNSAPAAEDTMESETFQDTACSSFAVSAPTADDSEGSTALPEGALEIDGAVYTPTGEVETVLPEGFVSAGEIDGMAYFTGESGVIYIQEDGGYTRWELAE